jgi:transposase
MSQNLRNKRKNDQEGYDKHDITDRVGIYWLNKAGIKPAQISKVMDIPDSTVRNIIADQKENGCINSNKERKRSVRDGERLGRHIENLIDEAPFQTFDEYLEILKNGGVKISRSTLIKMINDRGFHSFFAAHVPLLSDTNKQKRVKWCNEHLDWAIHRWNDIVWSDESQFTYERSTTSTRVFRKKGDRYNPKYTMPKGRYSKGSVWVWGCFYQGGMGPLHVFHGRLKSKDYVEILKGSFLPWYKETCRTEGRTLLLQEDNATWHTSQESKLAKQDMDIKLFPAWPPQSPDLNPIENIWAEMERRLGKLTGKITNDEELERELKRIWEELRVEYTTALVHSMPVRCQAVVDNDGHPTRY